MRKTIVDLPQKIRDVIDEILKCSIDNQGVFGDYIASILFLRNQNALYLNSAEGCAYYFYSADKEIKRKEGVLFILELLSVLHDLEEKHLIFVIPTSPTQDPCLYYEGKQCMKAGQDPEIDIIDNKNTMLIINDSGIRIVDDTNKELLTGIRLPDTCISQICYYFSGIILPGNELIVYKKRGYLSEEQYNTKRALFRSRVANWIAIIIGCFTITMGVVNTCDSKEKELQEEGVKEEIVVNPIGQVGQFISGQETNPIDEIVDDTLKK